jgi:flagellin
MTTQVNLTAAINANLLSLQNTQTLLNQTQLALSTGKKVNSALDNPEAFFAAQTLTNRSGDLSNVLDGISQGVQTIQTANDGITAITSLLQQAKSVAQQALSEANANAGGAPTDVASLSASYNQILAQITNLSNDASYQGTNLLNSTTNTLTITYDETGKSTQTIQGVNFTAGSTGTQGTGYAAPISGTVALPAAGNVPSVTPATVTGTQDITSGTSGGNPADQIVINGTTITVGNLSQTNLLAAINGSAAGVTATVTGSPGSEHLVLTSNTPNTAITVADGPVGHTGGLADLGLAATTTNPPSTDSFTIQVGSATATTIAVGGQTTAQILAALNAVSGVSATLNSKNDLVISSTTANTPVTLGAGTGAGLADVGLTAGTTAGSTTGGGLGITNAGNGSGLDWASTSAVANINSSLLSVSAALTAVRAQASTLGQNLGTVQTYQSFNKNLINDLNAGANDLTAADTNQESAALLTLQTQQQLGISALSLASQAQQAVLKLFP